MAAYRVELTPSAERDLHALPRAARERIRLRVDALADNPRPPGSRGVQGTDLHRIRVGDYRVLYRVKDALLLVIVVRIGQRSIAYRRLESL